MVEPVQRQVSVVDYMPETSRPEPPMSTDIRSPIFRLEQLGRMNLHIPLRYTYRIMKVRLVLYRKRRMITCEALEITHLAERA